jgi:hypothetical protein
MVVNGGAGEASASEQQCVQLEQPISKKSRAEIINIFIVSIIVTSGFEKFIIQPAITRRCSAITDGSRRVGIKFMRAIRIILMYLETA